MKVLSWLFFCSTNISSNILAGCPCFTRDKPDFQPKLILTFTWMWPENNSLMSASLFFTYPLLLRVYVNKVRCVCRELGASSWLACEMSATAQMNGIAANSSTVMETRWKRSQLLQILHIAVAINYSCHSACRVITLLRRASGPRRAVNGNCLGGKMQKKK